MMQKSVAVYCASSSEIDQKYFDVATRLGKLLAESNILCINGAGNRGLMNAVSDAVLEHGGYVKGVIPQFMVDSGWLRKGLSETIITDTMHARKQQMAAFSDGVIALPGGMGTLEELLEILTWKQLGLYSHPIIILNFQGYYDSLLQMFETIVSEEFMRAGYRAMWQVATTPDEAIDLFKRGKEWENNFDKYQGGNP